MKIHRVVTMLGATTDTGKLASDMYDLNYKTYYSKGEDKHIPISHMDFQHMVRAFVKQNEETDNDSSRSMKLRNFLQEENETFEIENAKLKEDVKKTDDIVEHNDKIYKKNLQEQENKILELTTRIHNLQGMLKERDELLEQSENIAHKETESKEYWRNLYHDSMQFGGARYVFAEIPNNEYGKKLTRGMKVFLNNDSYTMRVRGQHIKPELKGTGATHYGQNIEQSTHLRVYIDKK
jgi:hypothetical protein